MKRIHLLALVVLSVASLQAFAYFDKYGQSGCGLGSMAFGPEKSKNQILAMTTNSTFSIQAFAISSGTSNCTPEKKVAAIDFINNNMAALEVDMAHGQGETLVSLSQIMGCKEGQVFGKSLQKYYGHIFVGKASSEEIYHSISALSQQDQELSSVCPQA